MTAESMDLVEVLPVEMLANILNYLDFTDLVNCRLVNNLFFSIVQSKVTNYLIRLHQYSQHPGAVHHHLIMKEKFGFSNIKTHRLTLEQIKTKLRVTPRKKIWIEALETDLRLPEIQELFTEFGSFVHSFSSQSTAFSPSIPATYLLQLVKNFQNLKSLTLCPAIFSDWEEAFKNNNFFNGQGLPLRNLKTLRFSSPNYFLMERPTPHHQLIPWPLILQKLVFDNQDFAPNLQNVYGVPDCLLNEPETMMMKMDKVNLIKSISYDDILDHPEAPFSTSRKYFNVLYGGENTLKNLSQFSDQQFLQLEELQMCISVFFYKQFRQIRQMYGTTFSKLLNKSRKTLKKLEIQPLKFFEHIHNNFPPLPNLTSLTFHDLPPYLEGSMVYHHHHHQNIFGSLFFPRGFDIRENFPNVSSIEIAVHISDSNFDNPMTKFEQYFPNHIFLPKFSSSSSSSSIIINDPMTRDQDSVFPKVRHLKLSKYQPACCVERLSKIFPNVVSLSFDLGLDPLIDILPTCFSSWPQLEELTMRIYIFENCYEHQSLDTTLTGISRSKLNEILLNQGDEGQFVDEMDENIEGWRVGPGIYKLKNLQKLKFVMKPESSLGGFRIPIYQPVMSPLSGQFGFGLIRGIEVTVECDGSSTRFQKEGIRRMFDNSIQSFLTMEL